MARRWFGGNCAAGSSKNFTSGNVAFLTGVFPLKVNFGVRGGPIMVPVGECIYLCALLGVMVVFLRTGGPSLFVFWEQIIEWRMHLALQERPTQEVPEPVFAKVWAIIREAVWSGQSLSWQMRELGSLLMESHLTEVNRGHFLKALSWRVFVVSAFALLVRVILLFTVSSFSGMDLLHLGLAWGISVGFLGGVVFYFPRPWFWDGDLTWEGESFLTSLFLGKVDDGSPISDAWRKLCEKEVLTGVPLRESRELLLEVWVERNKIISEQKRKTFEDFLPAGEFLFLGIPTLLILWTPCQFLWGFVAS
ncbi:MAG: hypothetical protein HYW48_10545 [Deltaproteobacteria bacterium]|nr:hypothetical protein [Deltaproteobacteria bacterium]